MSLIQRKPRPLIRDIESFRDDRLFIIACDDTYAPKQYFDFFRMPRIQVKVVETPKEETTSHAIYVLSRLLEYKEKHEVDEDDELWMLLDTDHCIKKGHKRKFIRAIKDAKEQGIKVALSRPCFEVWLLLHHVDESIVTSLQNAAKTEIALNNALNGEYDKTNLKAGHYPLSDVRDACMRAERLDKTVESRDIPNANTSRVYLLWKAILSKSASSQLPPELKNILGEIV
jgi:hypothetical protein